MAVLTKEYTDSKKNTHKVEHIILSANDKNRKEQIVEELFRALTSRIQHITT